MSVILICVLLLSARQLELPAGTLYSSFCAGDTETQGRVCPGYLISSFARFETGLLLLGVPQV